MEPHVKSSLLWGAIGTLSFLVLVQGYNLGSEGFVGLEVMVSVAVLVFVVTAVSAHVLRPHLAARNERP